MLGIIIRKTREINRDLFMQRVEVYEVRFINKFERQERSTGIYSMQRVRSVEVRFINKTV